MPTRIEWVVNSDGTKGKTWNPITGCTPVSEGCAHCYAKRMARRLAGRHGYPEAPHHFDVTLHPDRLDTPLKRRKPTTYFVCSMSDLFHKDVPPSFICEIWQVMRKCPQHTFQILTKRAQRMFEIVTTYIANDTLGFEPLSNVWGLVTAENQDAADKRIPWLLMTPFAVRGVSVEPMLGPMVIEALLTRKLHWVICGGESGPGARPMHPDWARSLRDQCQIAGVPFFFKQWGKFAPESHWKDFSMAQRNRKGVIFSFEDKRFPQDQRMYKVGKKTAGHLLDGRERHEFPAHLS